jgi:hypothetical protein
MNARLASADDKDALPSDGSGLLLGVIGGKYGCGRAPFICRVVHAAGLAAIKPLVRLNGVGHVMPPAPADVSWRPRVART